MRSAIVSNWSNPLYTYYSSCTIRDRYNVKVPIINLHFVSVLLFSQFGLVNFCDSKSSGKSPTMDFIIANVEHIEFKIERDLNEQYGSLPLPFPGMDSKF